MVQDVQYHTEVLFGAFFLNEAFVGGGFVLNLWKQDLMLICWKVLFSGTAGTKSQCKHSLAVQVTMDHSLKIIGLAAQD